MRPRAGSKALIREINEALVLDVVRAHRPVARARIAAETGLSPATVTGITARLLGAGLLTETDVVRSTGGRPARLIDLGTDAVLAAGVRLSDTEAYVVLVNLRGDVVAAHQEPLTSTRPQDVGESVARELPRQDTVFVDGDAHAAEPADSEGPRAGDSRKQEGADLDGVRTGYEWGLQLAPSDAVFGMQFATGRVEEAQPDAGVARHRIGAQVRGQGRWRGVVRGAGGVHETHAVAERGPDAVQRCDDPLGEDSRAATALGARQGRVRADHGEGAQPVGLEREDAAVVQQDGTRRDGGAQQGERAGSACGGRGSLRGLRLGRQLRLGG